MGWARHATFDPIVAIDTDIASLHAQFIIFEVRGTQRPAGGWPKGASGGHSSDLWKALMERHGTTPVEMEV